MAPAAASQRTAGLSYRTFLYMTVSAEIVKYLFDIGTDLLGSFVAVVAHATAGVIDKIVVAIGALDTGVGGMIKANRQHRPLDQCFTAPESITQSNQANNQHHRDKGPKRLPRFSHGAVSQTSMMAPSDQSVAQLSPAKTTSSATLITEA